MESPSPTTSEQSSHLKGPLSVFPPLPPLSPKLSLLKDLDGFFSNLQFLLSNGFDHCKHSLHCSFLDAVDKNPLLFRVLPPQLLASRPRQARHYRRGQHQLSAYNFAAVIPGDSIATVVVSNGILNFLNIYNTLLVVRLILTWFPNPPAVIVNPLSTICDPYLNIFRGIIPPLGGTLDLSPILAFLVLNVFTNSAAALPAELPTGPTFVDESSSVRPFSSAARLTQTQKAWLKRQASSLGTKRE